MLPLFPDFDKMSECPETVGTRPSRFLCLSRKGFVELIIAIVYSVNNMASIAVLGELDPLFYLRHAVYAGHC